MNIHQGLSCVNQWVGQPLLIESVREIQVWTLDLLRTVQRSGFWSLPFLCFRPC